jgi:hypothetical protein
MLVESRRIAADAPEFRPAVQLTTEGNVGPGEPIAKIAAFENAYLAAALKLPLDRRPVANTPQDQKIGPHGLIRYVDRPPMPAQTVRKGPAPCLLMS